jgi:predicted aspartyl protease
MRFWLLSAVALAVCAPALGEDCGKLRLVSSVALVASAHNTAEYVPVEIAGVPKLLLLDSNASMTVMTAGTAEALGLESHRNIGAPSEGREKVLMQSGHRREARLFADTGSFSDKYVLAPLVLGSLKNDSAKFMVAPEGVAYGDDERVAGVLGTDILQHFDVSIDFGKHTLALIDQNHCEGNVVYWPAAAVAILPFERLRSGAIVFQATLDGRPIKAILDTGAAISTLYQRPAEGNFGLTLGSADTPVAGTLDGEKGSTTWRHSFKTLTFGGVTALNPEFAIIPNRISKHFNDTELGSLIPQPDVQVEPDALLGMNVLKHLHVYIAYKEKKLTITPAETPAK